MTLSAANKKDLTLHVYFLYGFIAMVGTSYVNFLPGLVSALAGGIGFDDTQAGQIVSINIFGALIGSTLSTFLIRRVRWKPLLFCLLINLAMIDFASAWVEQYGTLIMIRLLAGILGGLSMGITFSVLARLSNPDRAFGSLLFIQFGICFVVMASLPSLEIMMSSRAVFYVMAIIAALGLVFFLMIKNHVELPLLPVNGSAKTINIWQTKTLFLLLSVALYLCAANGIWAYVEIIGVNAGFDDQTVNTYIGSTSLLGLLGALLPILSNKNSKRTLWVFSGITLSVASVLLLSITPLTLPHYVVAMSLLFFVWPAIYSFLLGITAEEDKSGQLSSITAVVSLLGSALGPLVAAGLIETGQFNFMLYGCAALFLLSAITAIKPLQQSGEQTSENILHPRKHKAL